MHRCRRRRAMVTCHRVVAHHRVDTHPGRRRHVTMPRLLMHVIDRGLLREHVMVRRRLECVLIDTEGGEREREREREEVSLLMGTTDSRKSININQEKFSN